MFAVSITNPEKVAILFHKFGGDSIVEDSHDNGITIFKSKPAPAGAAGATDPPIPTSYYVLTPHFLLYGSDKKALLKAAQSDSASGTARASALTDNPEISSFARRYPTIFLALSIMDYSQHNWRQIWRRA